MRKVVINIGTVCIIVIMCLTALPFAACDDGPPDIKNPDTFIMAQSGGIATLDPAFAYDTISGGQLKNIFDTLIDFDGSSMTEFVPRLATEWTISEDGKTYRFRIREGVSFHNGNPLTPEDVEYSFERGMVQDYALGPQWMLFEPLFGFGVYTSRTESGLIPLDEIREKVEVDGQWVQFNLAMPYEPFLQILASSWGSIVDMEWCIEHGDWDGTQESYQSLNNPLPEGSPIHSEPNGTGPFIFQEWIRGSEIRLVRNDNYWGAPASFERFITLIVPDSGPRIWSLETGDADGAVVLAGDIQRVKEMPGIVGYDNLPALMNQALFFQFEIDPYSRFIGSGMLDGAGIPPSFFSDADVRKGFAYAFDWDLYIHEALNGYGEQMSSPIVKGIPYFRADWPRYELDLAKAEEYFEAAYDGLLWGNGFVMTLAYASGDPAGKAACEILQRNLFEINPRFQIGIQLMEWPSLLSEMYAGRLPMYVNGWTADYPDPHNFVFPYMHSSGTFAHAQRYSNEAADDLIEQAISSADYSERQALYDQIAQLYYDEVPSIMICQVLVVHFFRDWIQGFVYNQMRPACEMYAYYLHKGYE